MEPEYLYVAVVKHSDWAKEELSRFVLLVVPHCVTRIVVRDMDWRCQWGRSASDSPASVIEGTRVRFAVNQIRTTIRSECGCVAELVSSAHSSRWMTV